ncbi:MAG TPA: hypothetical protein VLB83_01180 [Candidatus Paceibacterota bacterium]|nr:hypothetical protein [Candidatus Paceibacterota bacterium]
MDYSQVSRSAREEFYGLVTAMNQGETGSVLRCSRKLQSHLMQMANDGSEKHARQIESFAKAVAEYRRTGGTSPLPNFPD